jgi:hypothetical protein
MDTNGHNATQTSVILTESDGKNLHVIMVLKFYREPSRIHIHMKFVTYFQTSCKI